MSDRPITTMPYNQERRIEEEPNYRPRVVVKFRDGIKLAYRDHIEDEIKALQIGPWDDLARKYPGITLRRLFVTLQPDEIVKLVNQGREYDKTYQPPDFLTYFAIDCPPEVKPEALATDLSSWEAVQEAYVEGPPAPPPQLVAANQGYIEPADLGINVAHVRAFPGGRGEGIQLVDLEQGWTLNHEDLLAANIGLLSGINKSYLGHGTAVLGEIMAADNLLGGIGIAPMASCRVISLWKTATEQNIADAILVANSVLQLGDVLLIEAQTMLRGADFYPCEVETAIFDSIRACTARGVIVVEVAGNGNWLTNTGILLDTFATPAGKQVLNPNNAADFKDSGAILVAAATSTVPHQRMPFSNYGDRIDCYAWGEHVMTTGDGWSGNGTADYTTNFTGTSSAAPIIAGAAILVQGVTKARGGQLDAFQMRALLRDPMKGIAPLPSAEHIGVMPDLQKIII